MGIYFPGSHVLLFGMIKKKIEAPACTLWVGIYFTGRHVLLFGMIKKKILAPARTLRVGIYFTSRHVLLFGMIQKKNSWHQHVLCGRLCSPGGIYFTGRHVLLFGMIQKKFLAPACTLRALVLSGGHLLYG